MIPFLCYKSGHFPFHNSMPKMPSKRKTESKAKTKKKAEGLDGAPPQQRSSVYRGVTRHRWTGRFEAHLWDKDSWNLSQNKKGKQVYLGAYDDEAAAARAYDLAALKYWGQTTILNFQVSVYEEQLKEMEGQTKEEYIGSLRRKSSGFSRGVSRYRGVARHHHNGKWEARIGRVFGNKYLYLGTFETQEEAATAYDMAAIKHRGTNAVTNFDISRYINFLNPNSNTTSAPETRPTTSRKRRSRSRLTLPNSDESSQINPGSSGGEVDDEALTPDADQPTKRCFPDHIQTYFACHEPITASTDVFSDAILFGGFTSFSTTPFVSFDFDTNEFVL